MNGGKIISDDVPEQVYGQKTIEQVLGISIERSGEYTYSYRYGV